MCQRTLSVPQGWGYTQVMKKFLASAMLASALAVPASALPALPTGGAFAQAERADNTGFLAQTSGSETGAKQLGAASWDGQGDDGSLVQAGGARRAPAGGLTASNDKARARRKGEPPAPGETKESKGPPKALMYGGSAVLGGLQGFLTGGLFGAAAGAVLGLGSAYFFAKGDYGAAFGIAAGGVVGAIFGGPIGALIGGAIGGLLGHFIGKLFK